MKLELFGCAGGMAEGFRRAGITFDMVVDKDPDACDSYEQNLGHRPVQLDARDLLRMARLGWRPESPIQLFVADPPCTPWSRAGKREGTEDERDMLHDTTELIVLLKPVAFLVGNVPGLDDSTNWPIVQSTLGALPGYCVDYRALNAADYGVPQRRIRPFWFGHPKSTPCLRWPVPTHGDPLSIGHPELGDDRKPWRTCRDALKHLPLEELGKPGHMRMRKQNGKQHGSVADKPGRVVGTSNLSDGNTLMGNEKHPPNSPDEPSHTVTAKANQGAQGAHVLLTHPDGSKPKRTREFHNGHPSAELDKPAPTVTCEGAHTHSHATVLKVEGKGGYHVPQSPDKPSATITAPVPGPRSRKALTWPWDRPSTTIQRDERIDPPGHHPREWRSKSDPNCVVLSEKAAAILQGFPEDWVFGGRTKKTRWSQIGQAMPPALAEAVAQGIAAWLTAHAENFQTETPRVTTVG